MAFDGTKSTIHSVIYIVLSIFKDLKLEHCAHYRSTLFVDLNLEITQARYLHCPTQQISDRNNNFLQSYDKLNINRTLTPTKFHEG